MKIIKMTPSVKVPDRWYIELEDGNSLRVTVAIIADYSLFTGRELSEDELEKLKSDAGKASTKARALRMVGSRAMSRGELKEKLIQKGEDEDNINETADWLEKIGAINDEEYAIMLVRHYSSKGYGLGRIKNELYRRSIPKELWDEALSHMPASDEIIDKLISTKLKGNELNKNELKKLTDMLYRRGFTWEEISSAIRRYESNTEVEE